MALVVVMTLSVMGLTMAAMAAGLLVGKRLKGSCGGIGGPEACMCEARGLPKPPECTHRKTARVSDMVSIRVPRA